MSATSFAVIPDGAPSEPHWMVSVTRRGNIHHRTTLAPAARIRASPSPNPAGSPSTPPSPHAGTPPKSPAKLRHAQFVPYMNRFSQPQVTPALAAHASGTAHEAPPASAAPGP